MTVFAFHLDNTLTANFLPPILACDRFLIRNDCCDFGRQLNLLGLYDMVGNVYEWCLDRQRPYKDEPATDPIGPVDEGPDRVFRGGGWLLYARGVRSAFRLAYDPGY